MKGMKKILVCHVFFLAKKELDPVNILVLNLVTSVRVLPVKYLLDMIVTVRGFENIYHVGKLLIRSY